MLKTAVRLLPLVMALFLFSCSGGGDKFVGNWVGVEDPAATMTVSRSGDAYILTFRGGAAQGGLGTSATGVYKDGALLITRAGLMFNLVMDRDTGYIVTGFRPAHFKKRS